MLINTKHFMRIMAVLLVLMLNRLITAMFSLDRTDSLILFLAMLLALVFLVQARDADGWS